MLTDEQLAAVRSLLQVMVEPLSRSLASVPVDDKGISLDTADALERSRTHWRGAKAFRTKTSAGIRNQ